MGEKKEGQIIGGVKWILARALVVDLTPTRKLGERSTAFIAWGGSLETCWALFSGEALFK